LSFNNKYGGADGGGGRIRQLGIKVVLAQTRPIPIPVKTLLKFINM